MFFLKHLCYLVKFDTLLGKMLDCVNFIVILVCISKNENICIK